MKKPLIIGLTLILMLSLASCSKNNNLSSNKNVSSKSSNSSSASPVSRADTSVSSVSNDNTDAMDFTQIKAGNYSSLQGTWIEVAYGLNKLDGNGEQMYTGTPSSYADTLSVSSDKIMFDDSFAVIKGNTLTDNAGSHSLSFQDNGSSLEASLVKQDVAINWGVTFYQKGKNDLQKEIGAKIDNTKNIIEIWSSNDGMVVVFAQTGSKS